MNAASAYVALLWWHVCTTYATRHVWSALTESGQEAMRIDPIFLISFGKSNEAKVEAWSAS